MEGAGGGGGGGGPRIAFAPVAPDGLRAMRGLEAYVAGCGLDRGLLDLVRIRASQINGCAYCLDMHTQDARAAGEDERRLHLVAAWREAPCFSARERAALAWTEAVTRPDVGRVADEVYAAARAQFGERELVDLTWCVVAINGWNRMMISMRMPAGSYRPRQE